MRVCFHTLDRCGATVLFSAPWLRRLQRSEAGRGWGAPSKAALKMRKRESAHNKTTIAKIRTHYERTQKVIQPQHAGRDPGNWTVIKLRARGTGNHMRLGHGLHTRSAVCLSIMFWARCKRGRILVVLLIAVPKLRLLYCHWRPKPD